MLKKLLTILVCAVAVFAISCTIIDYDSLLAGYIFTNNNKVVEEDFVLPGEISTEPMSWSSESEYVHIVYNELDNTYTVQLVKPETGVQKVTLVATMGASTREFTFSVKATDVYDFSGAYTFSYNKTNVSSNLELPTTYTLKGTDKTCSIEWSVDPQAYITVGTPADGKVLLTVNPSSLAPEVKVYATFTYAGQSTTKTYTVYAAAAMDHAETVDYWYNNTGVTVEMKGYLVAVGTEYSSSYKNITCYIVDENFDAGYYLYRVTMDPSEFAQLQVGSHVTCTGTTNTNYNGLIETNAGGTLVVDEDVEPINVYEHAYAIDNELLAKAPSAIYHESQVVSLTNWKVKSVAKKVDSFGTKTLFTVTKGGVDVAVAVSKYMEGNYKALTDPKMASAIALQDTLKEGDWVNIKGILGNYNGFQVVLMDGADVTTGVEDTTTDFGATKLANAIKETDKVFDGNLVVANKEVTLPTVEGVEISYKLYAHNEAELKVANGKLVYSFANNASAHDKVHVEVSYKIGTVTYKKFYYTEYWSLSDADKAEKTAALLKVVDQTSGAYEIGSEAFPAEFNDFTKVTVQYSVIDEASQAYVSVRDGFVLLGAVTEDTTVTIRATFVCGEATYGKNVRMTIKPAQFITYTAVTEPVEGTDYYLATYSKGMECWWLADTEIYNKNYLGGVYSYKDAPKAQVVNVEGGIKIKLTKGTTVKYIKVTQSGTYYNPSVVDNVEEASVFTIKSNAKLGTILTLTFDKEVFLSQNYTNTQFGCWSIEGHENDSYSPAMLYTVSEDTSSPAEHAATEKETLKVAAKVSENVELPVVGKTYCDTYISWAIKTPVEGQTLNGSTLTVTRGDQDVTVTLTATFTCGTAVETKDFEIVVEAAAQMVDVATAYAAAQALTNNNDLTDKNYIVTGMVKSIIAKNTIDGQKITCYITDATGAEVELYNLATTVTGIKVGDVITVNGKITKYNSTSEFVNASSKIVSIVSATQISVTDLYNMFKDNTATAEQKATTFVVCGYVTKVQNYAGGTYTTGNYWITDGESEIELYKLGQLDGKFDQLVSGALGVGDYVMAYGKCTLYNGTVETSPTSLINIKKATTEVSALVDAWKNLKANNVTTAGQTEMPTKEGVTLTWSVTDESTLLRFEGNNAVVAELPEAITQVAVKVTMTAAGITFEKNFNITVAAKPQEQEGGDEGGGSQTIALPSVTVATTATAENGTLEHNMKIDKGYIKSPGVADTIYYIKVTNTSAYFNTTPNKITISVVAKGGTSKTLDAGYEIYVCLLDAEGNEMNVTLLTGSLTNTDVEYKAEITPTTSAIYGFKVYAKKTASYNQNYKSITITAE